MRSLRSLRGRLSPLLLGALVLSPGAASLAQTRHHARSSAHSALLPQKSTDQPAAAPSQPPVISWEAGLLTVSADNTDLIAILQSIAERTGIAIVGSVENTRVYGAYGPAAPAAVLGDLLKGMGYNLVMTGAAAGGAPARLEVSLRNGPASPPSPTAVTLASVQPPAAPAAAPEANSPYILGPGAIAHPKPEPSEDPQIRSAQRLQRLQQMHAAQEKAALNP